MECTVATDYLSALWCIVKSQFWETYTALTICIAIAGIVLWPLRRKLGLDQNGTSSISRANAIWSGLILLLGLGICVAFVAPYSLYTELAKANQKLTAENEALRDTRKREILEQLTVYLGVGRRFEAQLQNTGGITEMDKVRIKNWQDEVELAVAGSLYKDHLLLLKEPAGVPRSTPPSAKQPGLFTIWKSVNIMNYRIKELTDYIQSHEEAP